MTLGDGKPIDQYLYEESERMVNTYGNHPSFCMMASGKLQTLCYKAEIEAALRTPHLGGFQLLDLHDFPGQGTALVGVLNAFWDEKDISARMNISIFATARYRWPG